MPIQPLCMSTFGLCEWQSRDALQYYHLMEMEVIVWHNGGNDNDAVIQL